MLGGDGVRSGCCSVDRPLTKRRPRAQAQSRTGKLREITMMLLHFHEQLLQSMHSKTKMLTVS